MAGCRIVNAGVEAAVKDILSCSQNYRKAGEELVAELKNAISEMEGETKDSLLSYIEKDVNTFVATDLPDAVKGMSELLEVNRTNFEKVDKQISDSISGS